VRTVASPGSRRSSEVVIMDHCRLAARASRDCRSAGPDEDRADRRGHRWSRGPCHAGRAGR
jgi:hypothetical protein